MWADNRWVSTNIPQPGFVLHNRVVRIQVFHQIAGPITDQVCVIFCGTGKRISDIKNGLPR